MVNIDVPTHFQTKNMLEMYEKTLVNLSIIKMKRLSCVYGDIGVV